jgi:hypothetical protein
MTVVDIAPFVTRHAGSSDSYVSSVSLFYRNNRCCSLLVTTSTLVSKMPKL